MLCVCHPASLPGSHSDHEDFGTQGQVSSTNHGVGRGMTFPVLVTIYICFPSNLVSDHFRCITQNLQPYFYFLTWNENQHTFRQAIPTCQKRRREEKKNVEKPSKTGASVLRNWFPLALIAILSLLFLLSLFSYSFSSGFVSITFFSSSSKYNIGLYSIYFFLFFSAGKISTKIGIN